MLILSRQDGDRICIGSEIEIFIRRIKGNRVSLGIKAPREIEVDREEVRERKLRAAMAESVMESQKDKGEL